MDYSKIFDQKLNHDFSRVKKIDFFKNAEILGIRQNSGSLIFLIDRFYFRKMELMMLKVNL